MPQKDTLYGDLFVVGNFEANLIKKTGGTSSQFLKADGSVDSTAYLTTTPTLDAVTTAGNTTTNAISVGGLTVATNLIYTDLVNNRVFIGDTTSPQVAKLTIKSSDNSASGLGFVIYNTSTATNSYSAFKLYANNGAAEGQFYVDGLGGSMVVRTYTNHPMIFGTNATERLRIFASTGNIGINTSTDAGYKLDVNGTARVQGTTNFGVLGNTGYQTHYFNLGNAYLGQGYIHLTGNGANALFFTMGDSTSTSGVNSFQIIRWYDNEYGNNILTMSASDGRPISIRNGSNLASETLRASSSQVLIKRQQINSGSITASSAIARGVYFNNTLVAAANNDVLVGLDINPTFTSGAFTGVSNVATRIQNGALLIGTTLISTDTLSFPLQVNSSSQNVGAIWRNALSTGYTSFRFYNNINSALRAMEMGYAGSAYPSAIVTGGVTGESAYLTTTGAYPLQLGTNNTARFIIFSNGNIGVGTATDAGYKLNVNGNIALSGNLVPTAGSQTLGTFTNRFGDVWAGGLIVGTTFYGDNYQTASGTMFFKDGGGVERMRMTSVGNFLIGTTIDPGYKLTVNGDINTSGVFRVGGVAGWTGVITIPTNPPGQQNVDVQGGIIVNVF